MNQELTDKELRIVKWYFVHRAAIRRWTIILLIIINVIFWSLAIWNTVNYFLFKQKHQEMLQELTRDQVNYLALHQHFQPKDLEIKDLFVVRLNPFDQDKKIKYDFIALIENPNQEWMISSAEYYFFWTEGKTQIKSNFILPGEKKYLTALGETTDRKINKAEFVFEKINWQRIRPNQETPIVLSELSINNLNVDYAISEEKMIALPRITFLVKNQSVYGLRQVNFLVVLYRDKEIIGVNLLSVKNWRSNEEREMELIWPDIPQYNLIEIYPEFNPYNPENFISVY